MVALWKREFSSLFKGVKSIVILALFIGFSFLIAQFVGDYSSVLSQGGSTDSPYTAGLRFLVLLFGFFFVMMISHDIISKELDSQTIRFLVTKITRRSIIVGKCLGIYSFWVFVITISYVAVLFVSMSFHLLEYIYLLSFLSFIVGATVLLSTVVKTPSYTLMGGMVCSIAFPVIGVTSVLKEGSFWSVIKFLTPYHYYLSAGFWMCVPVLMGGLMLFAAVLIFERKDL